MKLYQDHEQQAIKRSGVRRIDEMPKILQILRYKLLQAHFGSDLTDAPVINDYPAYNMQVSIGKQIPRKAFPLWKQCLPYYFVTSLDLDYQALGNKKESFPAPSWLHCTVAHDSVTLHGTPDENEYGTYLIQLFNRYGYIVKNCKLHIKNSSLEELDSDDSSSSMSGGASPGIELGIRRGTYNSLASSSGAAGVGLEASPTLSQRSSGKRSKVAVPPTVYGRSASSGRACLRLCWLLHKRVSRPLVYFRRG